MVGVLPAWKVAQQHLIDAIKDGGQHVSRMLDRALMRRVMVAAQVAGSCLLLVVAGMMVRSVQRAMQSSLGFDYQHAAVLSMPLDRHGITVDAARSYWYRGQRTRARPPRSGRRRHRHRGAAWRARESRPITTPRPASDTLVQSVDPEYFAVMRIPLLSGRLFGPADAKTAIVSRRLALAMYGTLDVLGREFPKSASSAEATIIGVAGRRAFDQGRGQRRRGAVPATEAGGFLVVYLVARARTRRGSAAAGPARGGEPRPAGHSDREARCTRISTSDMLGPRMASMIAAGIGVLTLALACLGIFGVVSYGVALRTKEIGIRVALGAQQPALLRSIVRQVLTPVVIGAVIGLVLAIPAGIALRGEPFYLENGDPIAFASALAVFVGAGALAALWPAYLVLRRNPVDALRHS